MTEYLPLLRSTHRDVQLAQDGRDLLRALVGDPLLAAATGYRGDAGLEAVGVRSVLPPRPESVTWGAPECAPFTRDLRRILGPVIADFENLGDNCEFAGVQSRADLERPGLLRWSGVAMDRLVDLLDQDFAGADDRSALSLRLEARDLGAPEYMLDNAVLGAGSHTFTHPPDTDVDAVLKREWRRLVVLRRKLLEDLAEGGRIFVYTTKLPVSDAAVVRLGEAVRRHGPGRLLVVRLAGNGLGPADLRRLAPGVAVGALDRLALGNERHSELWPVLLLRAHRLLLAAEARPAPVLSRLVRRVERLLLAADARQAA